MVTSNHKKSSSSTPLKEAVEQTLTLGAIKEVNTVFLTRALKAINHLAESADLLEASTASSDYELLLKILEAPESLGLMEKSDPLSKARLRGLQVKGELLEANGGCISATDAAELLGISRQAVDKRRRANKLLAISKGKHSYIYPLWQFDRGGVIGGLEEALDLLRDFDPWMKITFMLEPNLRLGGRTPLEELQSKRVDEVLDAIRVFGEQGAD